MKRKPRRYEETHRTVNGRRQKLCIGCRKWKGESTFRINRATKDGLAFQCRDCGRDYQRKLYRKDKKHVKKVLRYEESHRTVRGVKQKLCSSCRQWKKESLFSRNRRLKDGLQWRCKECENKYAHKRYERIRKGERKYLRYEDRHRVVKGVRKKLCSKCSRWKNETGFYKDSLRKDGLEYQCKKCSYKTKAINKSRKK